MREKSNEPASLTQARAVLYCLLATGFTTPTAKNVREISELAAEVLRKAKLCPLGPAPEELKILQSCVNAADRSYLNAEYHRLFVGPYHLPAPPYASVYLESEPAVMGPSTAKVLRLYGEAGFSLSPSFNNLPDHIAAELEFMALLCEQEAGAWQKEDFPRAEKLLGREETFLAQHLAQWIPKFSSRISSSTESPFYRALASLVNECVLLDRDCVHALRALVASEGSSSTNGETRDGA